MKKILGLMVLVLCSSSLVACTTVKTATLQNGVVGDAMLLPITLPMAIAQDFGTDTPLAKKYCCSAKSGKRPAAYSSAHYKSNTSSTGIKKPGSRVWNEY